MTLTAIRLERTIPRKRLEIETPFQRTTNRKWHIFLSIGHVTEHVTWPQNVLWGSTVGYPSDSLASCTTSDAGSHDPIFRYLPDINATTLRRHYDVEMLGGCALLDQSSPDTRHCMLESGVITWVFSRVVCIGPDFGETDGRMKPVEDDKRNAQVADDAPWQLPVKLCVYRQMFRLLHFEDADDPEAEIQQQEKSDKCASRLQFSLSLAHASMRSVDDEQYLHWCLEHAHTPLTWHKSISKSILLTCVALTMLPSGSAYK